MWFPALPLSLPSLLLPQAFDPQPYHCLAGTWGKVLLDPPEVVSPPHLAQPLLNLSPVV